MTIKAHDFASRRISTSNLPPSRRLPVLRDLFDQSIGLDLVAEHGHAIEMEMHQVPGLRRAKMLSSFTARGERPVQRLADGEDTVCLMINIGGHIGLTQGKNEGIPQVGEAVLLVYRRPAVLEFASSNYVSVRVPLSALAGLAHVEDAAARRIPANIEALSLLRTYVSNLPDRIADARLGHLSASHVYDLMALSIGATKAGRDSAEHGGIRAARLEAIRADLISDATIDLDTLAARHGITRRYVQKLFEETGTTFSDFVLSQRLEASRQMLTSPRYHSLTISDIAFTAGFNDLSHFNRQFKKCYFMTPTDMRSGKRISEN